MFERVYTAGRVALSVAEGGPSGAPLLLLHGAAQDRHALDGLAELLGQRWELYAPDLRGHGRSGRAAGYRLDDYLDDVAALLERHLQRPTVAVGFALGALVALGLPERCPQLLRAVVAIEPSLSPRGWLGGSAARAGEPQPGERMPSQVDPAAIACVLEDRLLAGYQIERALAAVRCPALLLHGERGGGSAVRAEDVALALAHIPHLQVAPIAGAGHTLLEEQPEQTVAQIQLFLSALRPGGAR